MYANIEEVWDNNHTDFNMQICKKNKNNMMGTPVRRYKNNYNNFDKEYINDLYNNENDKYNEIIYNSNKRKKKIYETFNVDSEQDISDGYLSDNLYPYEKELDCIDYIKHILKCKKCYKILSKKFKKNNKIVHKKSNYIDKFLTNDVKEILTVIIIGIFIIIILDLFINLVNRK